MPRNRLDQKGRANSLILLAVIVVVVAGAALWLMKRDTPTDKTATTPSQTTTPQTTHTPKEATEFTQKTYDDYLVALNKANSDSAHTQPVAQAGLSAVKDNLSPDLYAKATAVTQATPFSCTAQYVTDKYTASLVSSDKNNATVALAISNGSNLSTEGMSVVVDLASLKIISVTCPS